MVGMGEQVNHIPYGRTQRQLYRRKIQQCLDVFEAMLAQSDFDCAQPLTGMEIEGNLIDGDYRPAMSNSDVLATIDDPAYQRELGAYNIELNVPPRPLPEHSGRALEADIRSRLNAAEAFETFLQTKYVGQKRFSLEGAETIIPMMDAVIDEAEFAHLAAFVLEKMHVAPEAELAILFVDEAAMEELHLKWMDEPGPTDVLSFPMDELRPGTPERQTPAGLLGDIVVCPTVAARQAQAAGHSAEEEMLLLTTHGILHLLGYDHAEPDEHKEMFGLQAELLTGWRASPEAAR